MPVLTIVFCDLLLNAFANIDDTLLLMFKLVLELFVLFALLLLLGGFVAVVEGGVLILLAVNAAAADNNERAPAAELIPVAPVVAVTLFDPGDIGGVLLGIAVVFV